MKKMKPMLVYQRFLMISLSFFMCTDICAQNTNRLDSMVQNVNSFAQKNKLILSKEKLTKATSIQYLHVFSSVIDDYTLKIEVSKSNVRLEISSHNEKDAVFFYNDDNEDFYYNENHAITSEEYESFINYLSEQNIRKLPDSDDILLTGIIDSNEIIVKIGDKVSFKGQEFFDLSIERGRLIYAFEKILPKEMQEMIKTYR